MTITIIRKSSLSAQEAFTLLRRAIEDQPESRAHDIVWGDLEAKGEFMGATIEFRVIPIKTGSETRVMISGPGLLLRALKGVIEKEIGEFMEKALSH
jgi:hypothetical protein